MKKIFGIILFALLSPLAVADAVKIAVVNVAELYNKSSFVQNANKNLQEQAKEMEDKLQAKKINVQSLLNDYEKTDANKRKELAQQIKTAQTELNQMTQEYQKKIQDEQRAGLQKFTDLVEKAVAKIAKEKQINAVLNKTSIVYSDSSWTDITNDVEAAMHKD